MVQSYRFPSSDRIKRSVSPSELRRREVESYIEKTRTCLSFLDKADAEHGEHPAPIRGSFLFEQVVQAYLNVQTKPQPEVLNFDLEKLKREGVAVFALRQKFRAYFEHALKDYQNELREIEYLA